MYFNSLYNESQRQCTFCRKNFGLFYSELEENNNKSPDNNCHNESESIQVLETGFRIPIIFNNCEHRICNICIDNESLQIKQSVMKDRNRNRAKSNFCPDCSLNNNDSEPNFQNKLTIDSELFTISTLKGFINQEHLVNKETNEKNVHLLKKFNEKSISSKIRKFILRCDQCMQQSQMVTLDCDERKNQESIAQFIDNDCRNYASIFCHGCEKLMCQVCYTAFHEKLATQKHNGISIENMKNQTCLKHGDKSSATSDLFCKDCCSFACSICVMKGIHKGHLTYQISETNQARDNLLSKRKKFQELAQHASKIHASLGSFYKSVFERINDKFYENYPNDGLTEIDCLSLTNQLQKYIIKLEQVYCIVKVVENECKLLTNSSIVKHLFLSHNKPNDPTLEQILDSHYLNAEKSLQNIKEGFAYYRNHPRDCSKKFIYKILNNLEFDDLNNNRYSACQKNSMHLNKYDKQNNYFNDNNRRKIQENQFYASSFANNKQFFFEQNLNFDMQNGYNEIDLFNQSIFQNNIQSNRRPSSLMSTSITMLKKTTISETYNHNRTIITNHSQYNDYQRSSRKVSPLNIRNSSRTLSMIKTPPPSDEEILKREIDCKVGSCFIIEEIQNSDCTHQVKQPFEFWTTPLENKEKYVAMHNQLNQWILSSKKNMYEPDEAKKIQINDIVVVKRDHKWFRARVNGFSKDENNKIEMLQLLLIDTGETSIVDLNEIGKISPQYAHIRPLAFKCTFNNMMFIDMNSDEHSNDDRKNNTAKILDVIDHWLKSTKSASKKLVIQKIINENENVYMVDITCDISKPMARSSLTASMSNYYCLNKVSLRECLICFKVACYVDEHTENTCLPYLPKYTPMQVLQHDESVYAKIAFFSNLDEFFLKRLYDDSDSSSEILMHSCLNETYKVNEEAFKIMEAVEGFPVAAKYDDEMWYRAQIVRVIPNELKAVVCYVEFGEEKIVDLLKLRYLQGGNAVREEVATFKCQLFGIRFIDNEKKLEAFNEVSKHITHKRIHVTIKNIAINNDPISSLIVTNKVSYEIIMRCLIDEKMTNINVLLTKMGFAECTNFSIYDGEEEQAKAEKEQYLKKSAPLSELEKAIKETCKTINENKILTVKPPNTIICKVTNVVSPNEIWVHDIADSGSFYETFQQKLLDKYKDLLENKSHVKDWQVNDLCVVNVSKRSGNFQLFRAKIIQKFENEYKVICLDNGIYQKITKVENIYELLEELKSKPEFKAKKCFLTGVQPTGTGDGEWSSLAKNYTIKTLTDSFVLVSFTTDNKAMQNDTHEVSIYVEIPQCRSIESQIEEKVKGASTYLRFADMLNIKGLALLIERNKPLDMLLANKSTFKTVSLLASPSTCKGYPEAKLSNKIYSEYNSGNLSKAYDVLVTHMDIATETIFIHMIKSSTSFERLKEMKIDFEEYYNSCINQDLKFTVEFINEKIKRKISLACVCKVKNKYYRGEILSQFDDEDLNEEEKMNYLIRLVDYGFEETVNYNQIFRPMIKYVKNERLAFKLKIRNEIGVAYDIRSMRDHIKNRIFKLKIETILNETAASDDQINDLVLIGDLFEINSDRWISSYFGIKNDESLSPLRKSNALASFERLSFKDSETPYLLNNATVKVLVSWLDDVENVFFQFVCDDDIDANLKYNMANLQTDEELLNYKLFLISSKENHLALKTMHNELLEHYNQRTLKLLRIERIVAQSPCCSFYKDNCIYRTLILSVNYIEMTALVRYIDFGNEYYVDFDQIFELDEKYFELPMQANRARLKNVKLNAKKSHLNSKKEFVDHISDQLYDIFYENSENLFAKIYMTENFKSGMEIEMFAGNPIENEDIKLAYQILIDQKLLTK